MPSSEEATAEAPLAVARLLHELTSKECIVSPKTKVLASTPKLAVAVADRLADLGWSFLVVRSGRDLGVTLPLVKEGLSAS